MQDKLEQLAAVLKEQIAGAKDAPALLAFEVERLGRKSEFNTLMKGLGALPADQRAAMGSLANKLKNEVQAAFDARKAELDAASAGAIADTEWIDVTVPGTRPEAG